VLGLEVAHSSKSLYDMRLVPKYCREDMIFGGEVQALDCYFKRLADAIATPPTFVFGEV